jgi:hypothetical protein
MIFQLFFFMGRIWMEPEKRMRILNEAHEHADTLGAYLERGGSFPLSESDDQTIIGREIAAVEYFLGKARIWSALGGKANSVLTPIFKMATRHRQGKPFDSGVPLDRFGGTMRIVLNAEEGCVVSSDRGRRIRHFLDRVVELTAEEMKKMR